MNVIYKELGGNKDRNFEKDIELPTSVIQMSDADAATVISVFEDHHPTIPAHFMFTFGCDYVIAHFTEDTD